MKTPVQITLIIIIGIIVLALISIFTVKSFISPKDTIDVNGQSILEITPDLITIYFSVETQGKTYKEAEDLNSEITQKLKTGITTKGFDEKELKTQNFNILPEYEWKDGQREIIGYKTTHSLKIELSITQTDLIGDIIDAGTDSGAGISSINFELSPELEQDSKAQAIELAAQDARIKAEALATGFNKKIGKLVSVSLDDWGYSPWRIYGSAESVTDMAMAKTATANITPSEQDVSAYVSARYKLR